MKNNNIPETDDDVMVTIELDGEDLDCEILTIFDIDNQDYIVLMPVDENGEPLDDTLVYIYRYFEPCKTTFPDYKKYKLGIIAENLGIKVEVAHRALDDVFTLVKV